MHYRAKGRLEKQVGIAVLCVIILASISSNASALSLAGNKPDLTGNILSSYPNAGIGEDISLKIATSNAGLASAGKSVTRVFADGVKIADFTVQFILPSSLKSNTVKYRCEEKGSHVILATVDFSNAISESDENNNHGALVVNCGSPRESMQSSPSPSPGGDYHYTCDNTQCARTEGKGVDECITANDCFFSKHAKCVESNVGWACQQVSGFGRDECGSDGDCSKPASVCVGNSCVQQGRGKSQCKGDSDCSGSHLACVDKTCAVVPGPGENNCAAAGEYCGTKVGVCENSACIQRYGNRTSECSVNSDCAPASYGVCKTKWQWIPPKFVRYCDVKGGSPPPGQASQCTTNPDCKSG